MQRRDLLKLAAFGSADLILQQTASPLSNRLPIHSPILDAHIHLFDPTRPGGVIWPTKADTLLYQPALPDRYRGISARQGIVGAIAIEASPLATDNDWLLGIAAKSPLIVGIIGNLIPGSPSYLADLERLHRNPLYLGFRYGNLWNRDLSADLVKPGFLDGLKALAATGLVFESANPNPPLIAAILKIAEAIPTLRIVIDHLPHAPIPVEKPALDEYNTHLRALAQHPEVFVKLSEIPIVADGKLITDPHHYQGPLDAIWNLFGEDRIIYGSDWPNSDTTASFDQTFSVVQNYMNTKSPSAREKYFFQNSLAAYRWHPRLPSQAANNLR